MNAWFLDSELSTCFFRNCLKHKMMTKNKMIMMNKAAPPTDPAIIGMDDSILESFSGAAPVLN